MVVVTMHGLTSPPPFTSQLLLLKLFLLLTDHLSSCQASVDTGRLQADQT